MVRHAATPAIRRLLVLAVCAGLTTGATGCGDSEGGPDGGAGPSASAATSDERPQSPPEQRSTGPEQRGEQADTAPADGGDGASAAPDARAPERRPSEDPPPVADSEETAVAAVATSMYDAYSRGDAAGVCAVLSDGARKQVSGGAATEAACQETLGRLFAATGGNPGRQRVGATKVDDVRVDGGSATVTVSLGRQRASTRLIKEDGNWRFASLQDPGSQAR